MKKYLVLLAVAFLFASLTFPLVSAVVTCPAAWTTYTDAGEITLTKLHPSTSASYKSAVGEAFTANVTTYLDAVQFRMKLNQDPTGVLQARLYSKGGGTVGVDAYPNNADILAYSASVAMDTIPASFTWITFTFDGSYQLVNATDYIVAVVVTDATGLTTTGHSVSVEYETGYSGNRVDYAAGWSMDVIDIPFIIVGDSEDSGATPTPTPTPAGGGGGDADMEALTEAILPFLVPLLVCLIPALLGYKFVGELGFFIGLNVGVILAYVTLAGTTYAFPLWGIILVGVMDVAVVLMRR